MMKHTQSESLFERSKRVVPGGVHSPVRSFRGVGGTPRFISKAEGATLTDVDGNTYTDFCLSWGPLLFGHRDPEIAEAVHSALSRGWSFGTTEPYSLELAETITNRIPWVEKIRFVNSGTEAVMAALRVARAATGRSVILKFDGCYHGHVDSMLVRAGSGLADMASPDSAGVSVATAAETLVAPLDNIPALEEIFELHGSRIAGAIIEPLPANNGLLIQTQEVLTRLQSLCKKHGALLIFDEVISGFRVSFGGMAETTGIRPDLVTYGKIIGGGFPVGAYGGKAEFMNLVAPAGPVYQAGTLSANPVAMIAGQTMVNKLIRENPYVALAEKTERLAKRIEAATGSSVQRYASLLWAVMGPVRSRDGQVRSIDQIPETQKSAFSELFHRALDRGVYLAPSGFEVSFLSTAHTEDHFDHLIEAIRA